MVNTLKLPVGIAERIFLHMGLLFAKGAAVSEPERFYHGFAFEGKLV